VIILSITLATLLVLSIIATSLAIKLLKKAQSIADTAQLTADNVEEFTEQLKSAGKITAIGSALGQLFEIIKKGRK
jgi:chromosome condensin MukBEF ATPase and DNA-binding subunit MukB